MTADSDDGKTRKEATAADNARARTAERSISTSQEL